MANIELNTAGIAALERQAQQKLAVVMKEANEAAEQHDTLEAKAAAFGRVLKKHGMDPNEGEIRRAFQREIE